MNSEIYTRKYLWDTAEEFYREDDRIRRLILFGKFLGLNYALDGCAYIEWTEGGSQAEELSHD